MSLRWSKLSFALFDTHDARVYCKVPSHRRWHDTTSSDHNLKSSRTHTGAFGADEVHGKGSKSPRVCGIALLHNLFWLGNPESESLLKMEAVSLRVPLEAVF